MSRNSSSRHVCHGAGYQHEKVRAELIFDMPPRHSLIAVIGSTPISPASFRAGVARGRHSLDCGHWSPGTYAISGMGKARSNRLTTMCRWPVDARFRRGHMAWAPREQCSPTPRLSLRERAAMPAHVFGRSWRADGRPGQRKIGRIFTTPRFFIIAVAFDGRRK